MIFALKVLRKLALKSKHEAETLLQQMVRKWIENTPSIGKVFIIFDGAVTNLMEDNMEVISCADYTSPEDTLVELAKKLDKENTPSVAFVTSSIKLTEEIAASGAHVIHPKSWFNSAASAIEKVEVNPDNLDDWADQFTQRVQSLKIE
jgi:hypothetical protein